MSSCCLGDRIYSFPCRASYFALGRIWRKDGWIHPFLLIILVQFIIFFKSSYCKIASAPRNSVPNTAVTTFAFSSVFILLLCFTYTAAFFIFVLLEPPFSYFCYWNLHFHIFVIVTSIFIFLLLEPPFSYFCYWNLHFYIFVIGTSIFIFLLLESLFSYFCYWNLLFHIFFIGTFFSAGLDILTKYFLTYKNRNSLLKK